MNANQTIKGFSKLTKDEKISWLSEQFIEDQKDALDIIRSYWHGDARQQEILDGFSENTISNFPMPYGIAPNFVINDQVYAVPMVIEESSVVAAASAAAKFWMTRGGFDAQILGVTKVGQLHFKYLGKKEILTSRFDEIKEFLIQGSREITKNMDGRGGGILGLELLDFTEKEADYFQIRGRFKTCDSMGANFINSILELWGQLLKNFFVSLSHIDDDDKEVQIIMAILSNYTPECIVRAKVSCSVEELGNFPNGIDAHMFAEKFRTAVRIAEIDPYRATTHNKGIYNGVDAVVLATGNDFRAIEACGHTYASRNGQYESLSHCEINKGVFTFWMDLPLAVGTVGGLTKLHPLAKMSLDILNKPNAEELMMIIATVGLAQNFAALRSLVTTGIQQGHMKMHLQNILNQLDASPSKTSAAIEYFKDKTVSFSGVRSFLEESS